MQRILIIEDEAKLLANLHRGLCAEGYDAVAARSGEEGHDLARHELFHAIILDLMLPGRTGLEVLRDLRKSSCKAPVLILTAMDALEDRVTGLDSGADDYMVKPFAFAELLARLRALLRRNVPASDVTLRAGDLEMDRLSRRVTRAGTEIELSTREFALLEYLLQHADSIVTRSMIARDVWNAPDALLTNVIDVYIGTLRRKISRADRRPLIHTVRGVGYELRSSS
jgi:DNA-binding response OmpR family regulator